MPPDCVIPVLDYPSIDQAILWLGEAFGFSVRLRIGDHRAQLHAGCGTVVITARPKSADPPAGHSIMVRVENVDAHHDRAANYGALVLEPPATFPYGERQYNVLDIAGHHWTFSETIEDVNPADWGGSTPETGA